MALTFTATSLAWIVFRAPDLASARNVTGVDEIFTILMGDEVEPRRNFIQTHALEVRNLDV